MELTTYIAKIGDAKFAAMFGVKPRTAMSYRLKERYPRRELAEKITAKTPVTWQGIYTDGKA